MTTQTSQFNQLKDKDIYSLLLFLLYKLRDVPKYSTLSELAYLLDKKELLNLCEYYGGLTITIPTIQELERMLNALLLYVKVDIEHKSIDTTIKEFSFRKEDRQCLLEDYTQIKQILKDYNFNI